MTCRMTSGQGDGTGVLRGRSQKDRGWGLPMVSHPAQELEASLAALGNFILRIPDT